MTRRGTCSRCGTLAPLDSILRIARHRKVENHLQWCPTEGRLPLEAQHLVRPVAPLGVS